MLGKRDLNSSPSFTQAAAKTEVHEVKLATANADCKLCRDEIEVARVLLDSIERRTATLGIKTGLATQLLRKISSGHELR